MEPSKRTFLNSLRDLLVALFVGLVAGGFLLKVAGTAIAGLAGAAVALLATAAVFVSRGNRQGIKTEAEQLANTLESIGKGQFDQDIFTPVHLPVGQKISAALSDMSEKLRIKVEQLHDSASRDMLTGLGNRIDFERLAQSCLQNAEAGSPHCLLFIDLDGFKEVNDTLGHALGDRLLQIAADRLRLACNLSSSDLSDPTTNHPSANIARFGGDEFVVFLGNIGSGTLARRLASRILRVLSEPFELASHTATISASIGVAFSPENGVDYIDLLRSADTAMYHAKRSGRGCCEFYTPSLDSEARLAIEQQQELREAIARGQLELYFQPLFDVQTMLITSAEALIRWNHPVRGLLLPGDFLPLVERCNLTFQLGEWVLNEALQRIAELERMGMPLIVAVNISPLHIADVEFAALVRSNLKRWGASPHLLQIEVTEDAAMSNAELASERLRKLRDLGVSIAIDDFGTGYSNLARLIMLPLSHLKIDRSLLQNLCTQPEARVLIQTIISMANALGFHSVAEGVETQDQFDLLSDMGCDVVQGYLFSRPISLKVLKDLLDKEQSQDIFSYKSTMAG